MDPPDDLTGTVILVGLLCRASVVLEDDFPAIGIFANATIRRVGSRTLRSAPAEGESGNLRRRLSGGLHAFRAEDPVLYASMAEVRRKNRSRAPAPRSGTPNTPNTPNTAATAETAKPIVREALVDAQTTALEGWTPVLEGLAGATTGGDRRRDRGCAAGFRDGSSPPVERRPRALQSRPTRSGVSSTSRTAPAAEADRAPHSSVKFGTAGRRSRHRTGCSWRRISSKRCARAACATS